MLPASTSLERARFLGTLFLDGGRSLRLLANAGEESPDTTRQHAPRKWGRAGRKFFATESVTENIPLLSSSTSARIARSFGIDEARLKRRGKSPPPLAKARGHDKPHAVQDRTGGRGRLPNLAKASLSLRVIVAARELLGTKMCRSKINDRNSQSACAIGGAQNPAYSHQISGGGSKKSRLRPFSRREL
jgi:hypothetical protein